MSPIEAAAARRLDIVLSSDLPDLAARWLVEGLDTPALRELAGYPRDDPWVIDTLWSHACDELGVAVPESGTESIRVMARHEVRLWRSGHQTTERTMDLVLLLESWDIPDALPELWHLAGLDDELTGGWGRQKREIMSDVEQALRELGQRLEQ